MKNPFTLLVVEDRDNHLEDVKAVIAAEQPRLPIQLNVLYARNLNEALSLFDSADGVMTDVFFPVSNGEEEVHAGQTLVGYCLTENKPVVWVTSTYHHGNKTDPINNWGRQRGLEMFDCPSVSGDHEALHKPWRKALYGLFYSAVATEIGECFLIEGRLMGPERKVFWSDTPQRDGFRITEFLIERFFFSPRHEREKLTEGKDDPTVKKMLEMGFRRDEE